MQTVYFGLDPSRYVRGSLERVTHVPLIRTVPRAVDWEPVLVRSYTHWVVTSRTTARLLPEVRVPLVVVGRATEEVCLECGFVVCARAQDERQEGVWEIVRGIQDAYFLLPGSSMRRLWLQEQMTAHGMRWDELLLYDTVFLKPEVDPERFDRWVFTSASCVRAFRAAFPHISLMDARVHCIGPVTLLESVR